MVRKKGRRRVIGGRKGGREVGRKLRATQTRSTALFSPHRARLSKALQYDNWPDFSGRKIILTSNNDLPLFFYQRLLSFVLL